MDQAHEQQQQQGAPGVSGQPAAPPQAPSLPPDQKPAWATNVLHDATPSADSDTLNATSDPPGTPSGTPLSSQPPLSRHSGHTTSSQPLSGSNTDARSWTSTVDTADLEIVDYFPAEDSSIGSGPETPTVKRSGSSYVNDGSRTSLVQAAKPSSSSRLIRYLSKRLGRSFNRAAGFRGRAFLPNDQIERDRNILQHHLIQDVLDKKLFLSPVKPRTVLDVGTGPGVWCLVCFLAPDTHTRELELTKHSKSRYPEAQVLGIDVDPVHPPYKVPNCHFREMDASKPWKLDHQTFDLIHMRMVGELPNGKRQLFDDLLDHLNPGGWIEITEWLVKFQSPNHSLDKFNLWNNTFRDGLRKFGSSPFWALGWKDIMLDKGCINVTERKYPVPANPWAPGKRLQKQGAMMEENVSSFLEGATMPVFTGALGWTEEQVRALLASLKVEVADTNVHAFLTLMTVFCQKPRVRTSRSHSSLGRPSASFEINK